MNASLLRAPDPRPSASPAASTGAPVQLKSAARGLGYEAASALFAPAGGAPEDAGGLSLGGAGEAAPVVQRKEARNVQRAPAQGQATPKGTTKPPAKGTTKPAAKGTTKPAKGNGQGQSGGKSAFAGNFSVSRGPLQFNMKAGSEGGEAEAILQFEKPVCPPIVLAPGIWIDLKFSGKAGVKAAIAQDKLEFHFLNAELAGKPTLNGGLPGVFHVGGGGKATIAVSGTAFYDTQKGKWDWGLVVSLKAALVVEAAFDALGAADYKGEKWGAWMKKKASEGGGAPKTNAGLNFEYNPGGEVELAKWDLKTGQMTLLPNPLEKNVKWLKANPPKPQPSHHPGSYEDWKKKQDKQKPAQKPTTPKPPTPGPRQKPS